MMAIRNDGNKGHGPSKRTSGTVDRKMKWMEREQMKRTLNGTGANEVDIGNWKGGPAGSIPSLRKARVKGKKNKQPR